MKKLLVLALVTPLAGCGTFGTDVSNFIEGVQTNVINPTAALLSNPNTKIVFKAAEAGVIAAACVASAGSALAGKIESADDVDKSLQGTNLKFYTTTGNLCTGLGGVFSASESVNTGTSIVTGVTTK